MECSNYCLLSFVDGFIYILLILYTISAYILYTYTLSGQFNGFWQAWDCYPLTSSYLRYLEHMVGGKTAACTSTRCGEQKLTELISNRQNHTQTHTLWWVTLVFLIKTEPLFALSDVAFISSNSRPGWQKNSRNMKYIITRPVGPGFW